MTRKRGVARRSFAHRRVRRVKKYDHHVVPRRFKLLLPSMSDELIDSLPPPVECEEPTMTLLESLGVPTDEWQYYLGFMKRMIALYQSFTEETLAKEKESLIEEYVLREKNRDVLEAVQEVAAGCVGVEIEMDLWTKDFYKLYHFQDRDGFELGEVNTGSVFMSSGAVVLATGLTINSEAEIADWIFEPTLQFTWDKERRFRVGLYFDRDTQQLAYIVSGDRFTGTSRYIGFKIVNNQIFGCVCNGTVETLTGALYTFFIGEILILEVKFLPNQECRFYINGIDVGVLTSGLPSGTVEADCLVHFFITNTAASDKYLWVDQVEFYQKR